MSNGELVEYGARVENTFEGVSRGPGASLERAIQQAARAAAEAGQAGKPFDLVHTDVEPQDHNQWVRTFRVIITTQGGG